MICTYCKEECEVVYIDEGIGMYEYWGCVGRHEDWVEVSDCCQEPIKEKE